MKMLQSKKSVKVWNRVEMILLKWDKGKLHKISSSLCFWYFLLPRTLKLEIFCSSKKWEVSYLHLHVKYDPVPISNDLYSMHRGSWCVLLWLFILAQYLTEFRIISVPTMSSFPNPFRSKFIQVQEKQGILQYVFQFTKLVAFCLPLSPLGEEHFGPRCLQDLPLKKNKIIYWVRSIS